MLNIFKMGAMRVMAILAARVGLGVQVGAEVGDLAWLEMPDLLGFDYSYIICFILYDISYDCLILIIRYFSTFIRLLLFLFRFYSSLTN